MVSSQIFRLDNKSNTVMFLLDRMVPPELSGITICHSQDFFYTTPDHRTIP